MKVIFEREPDNFELEEATHGYIYIYIYMYIYIYIYCKMCRADKISVGPTTF